jgi:AraC-like DNA-binding protein
MDAIINPLEYIGTLAVCFFGAFLLFRHQEDNTIRRSWAFVLLVWGCIQFVLLYLRYILGIKAVGGTPDDPFFNASVTVGNILAFLLYIYPTQVLRPGWLNWWRSVLLLLPMIVLGVVDYFVEADLLKLIMIYPAVIFLLLCRHVRKYRQWCEDNFSTMDDIDVQWIVRYLTMLFIVGASFYFIVFWYVPNRMFTQNLTFILILSYTTERVLYRPDPWTRLRTRENEEDKTDELSNTANMAMLDSWMKEQRPYLSPDFQLLDLQQVLPLNRTYLSQLINSECGCSFYQWVNRFRIEEAEKLIAAQPGLKLQDIAERCGFSSPTMFTRAFLRETGVKPSEWKG